MGKPTESASFGVEDLEGLQGLFEGERVASIQGVVTEEAEHATVNIVGTGFRDDIDGSAVCAAQVGSEVTAIHLEFLNRRPGSSWGEHHPRHPAPRRRPR